MNDHKEYIKNLFKYVSTDSVLYVDKQGRLRRLYCLFKAIIIRLIPNHSIGDKVSVEAVKITLELKEVYIIRGKAYYVYNFRITPEN